MSLEKLLQHPEQFRTGANYRATHTVFPVEYGREKYIIKKVRPLWNTAANLYYSLQNRTLADSVQWQNPYLALEIEARKLQHLQGKSAPRIHGYQHGILAREYIPGQSFRELQSQGERTHAIQQGIVSLRSIHERKVALGDAHLKNVVAGKWVDVGGSYANDEFAAVAAGDVLKLIYSVYALTRDESLTRHAAELAAEQYAHNPLRKQAAEHAGRISSGIGLWLAARLPFSSRLPAEIAKTLSA